MFPQLIFGGDYNPDQWPEAIWEEDLRLMQEAGINLVSLGIFSWSKLELQPGVYDFAWLDRIIELLYARGVSVNLATPTASPPPWLVRLDPDILPVTADGVRLSLGSRRQYCPPQPDVSRTCRPPRHTACRTVSSSSGLGTLAYRQRVRLPRR